MEPTRIRVQLQQGNDNLRSIPKNETGLKMATLIAILDQLVAETVGLFSGKDQMTYKKKAKQLRKILSDAAGHPFEGKTAGNQLRKDFMARREGK